MAMGCDLAGLLGERPTALMRGHGSVAVGRSVRRAVYNAVKLQVSADLQAAASRFDKVTFLSPGEIREVMRMFQETEDKPLAGMDRTWEYWCRRAGVPFKAGG